MTGYLGALTDTAPNSDYTVAPYRVDVTATADGTGTGQIEAGTQKVTVTSANAAHIVTLPTDAEPFSIIALYVGANGYELAGAINDGDGTSAIPAETLTVCVTPDGETWRCTDQADDGTVVTTEVAS